MKTGHFLPGWYLTMKRTYGNGPFAGVMNSEKPDEIFS
jgi:hypothetical protein